MWNRVLINPTLSQLICWSESELALIFAPRGLVEIILTLLWRKKAALLSKIRGVSHRFDQVRFIWELSLVISKLLRVLRMSWPLAIASFLRNPWTSWRDWADFSVLLNSLARLRIFWRIFQFFDHFICVCFIEHVYDIIIGLKLEACVLFLRGKINLWGWLSCFLLITAFGQKNCPVKDFVEYIDLSIVCCSFS